MSNVEVYGDTNQVVVDETTNVLEVTSADTTVEVSSTGVQGARGTLFLSGNGLPTADIGVDGDFYIDTSDNAAVYGPKVNGAWPTDPTGRFSQFTLRHTHTQVTPASTWVIEHELGGKPSVTVVDSADTVVIGEVTYVNNTTVSIEFTGAFSGYAYLT